MVAILIPVMVILGTLTSVQQWQSDCLYSASNRSNIARKSVPYVNLCISLRQLAIWRLGSLESTKEE